MSAWRLRMLEEAAEIGIDLMRSMRRQALAAADAEEAGVETSRPEIDFALRYQRINRALRQALALHARFEDEARRRGTETAAATAARLAEAAQRAEAARESRKRREKILVKRAAERAIFADVHDDDEGDEDDEEAADPAQGLLDDLNERLEYFNDYSNFGRCSIGETLFNLLRAMGLAFDPAMWADEPWAIEEMRTKPDGSPYADWQPELANDDDPDAFEEERADARERGPP
jgi:hypothetical protein